MILLKHIEPNARIECIYFYSLTTTKSKNYVHPVQAFIQFKVRINIKVTLNDLFYTQDLANSVIGFLYV